MSRENRRRIKNGARATLRYAASAGLAFLAVDPAIVTHAGVPPTVETRPKVGRTLLEHLAATCYRWGDRLHMHAARKSK